MCGGAGGGGDDVSCSLPEQKAHTARVMGVLHPLSCLTCQPTRGLHLQALTTSALTKPPIYLWPTMKPSPDGRDKVLGIPKGYSFYLCTGSMDFTRFLLSPRTEQDTHIEEIKVGPDLKRPHKVRRWLQAVACLGRLLHKVVVDSSLNENAQAR